MLRFGDRILWLLKYIDSRTDFQSLLLSKYKRVKSSLLLGVKQVTLLKESNLIAISLLKE